MPNFYRYFESGEISDERLFLEIQLFQQCEQTDLNHIDWSGYDTSFLRQLARIGIDQVDEELIRREKHPNEMSEEKERQAIFIERCLRQSMPPAESQKTTKWSWSLIFIIIYLHLLLGYFLYEYYHHRDGHPFKNLLHRPLTTRRRHLSFDDDFFIILLTMALASVVICIITATRSNRWILLIGILMATMLLFITIQKAKQIVTFLSKFREIRMSTLFDSIDSQVPSLRKP